MNWQSYRWWTTTGLKSSIPSQISQKSNCSFLHRPPRRNIISKSEDADGDSTKILNIFNRLLSQKQKDTKIAEIYAAYVSLKKMPQDSLVSALNRILEIEPDNKGARIELIRTLWDKEDKDELIKICKPAVDYCPDEMVFYYFLGFAYIQK